MMEGENLLVDYLDSQKPEMYEKIKLDFPTEKHRSGYVQYQTFDARREG